MSSLTKSERAEFNSKLDRELNQMIAESRTVEDLRNDQRILPSQIVAISAIANHYEARNIFALGTDNKGDDYLIQCIKSDGRLWDMRIEVRFHAGSKPPYKVHELWGVGHPNKENPNKIFKVN